MAELQIGDKVKVTGTTMSGATGEIKAKSVRPKETANRVVMGREYNTETSWHLWQVKLDRTGNLRTFPDAELEKIE